MTTDERKPGPAGQSPSFTSEQASATASLMEMRTAWISFYDTHYHRVVRFVMHDGASLEDAQDAAHEAFTDSWTLMATDPTRWAAITNQPAWIRTVALRKYRRPPGPRRRLPLVPGAEIPGLPCSRPGPGEMTVQTQLVLQALSILDAEARAVMAFCLDDFITAEIATALGITEQRVRDVKKKARATLKRTPAVTPEGRDLR